MEQVGEVSEMAKRKTARAKDTRKAEPAKDARSWDRHSPDTAPVHVRILRSKTAAVEELLEALGGKDAGMTKTRLVDHCWDEFLAGRFTLPEPRPEDAPAARVTVDFDEHGEPLDDEGPDDEGPLAGREGDHDEPEEEPAAPALRCPDPKCTDVFEDRDELDEHVDMSGHAA